MNLYDISYEIMAIPIRSFYDKNTDKLVKNEKLKSFFNNIIKITKEELKDINNELKFEKCENEEKIQKNF
ncbi:hypothetical protein [Oceanivirga salmonicida]|uniref:hypothetical protein n=1 Tax=Oceanivirga salmonicida TaxID=1769291 RepID=UPI0012E1D737|nr:hypothetical protein [Oceanivirga salmonicida]